MHLGSSHITRISVCHDEVVVVLKMEKINSDKFHEVHRYRVFFHGALLNWLVFSTNCTFLNHLGNVIVYPRPVITLLSCFLGFYQARVTEV